MSNNYKHHIAASSLQHTRYLQLQGSNRSLEKGKLAKFTTHFSSSSSSMLAFLDPYHVQFFARRQYRPRQVFEEMPAGNPVSFSASSCLLSCSSSCGVVMLMSSIPVLPPFPCRASVPVVCLRFPVVKHREGRSPTPPCHEPKTDTPRSSPTNGRRYDEFYHNSMLCLHDDR